MPRRLRIQYPGAIYHLMSRGNARQDVVEDDRRRLLSDLERVPECCGWAVVKEFDGLEPDAFARRHYDHITRAVAAWLFCRHTEARSASRSPAWASPAAKASPA